MTVHTLKTWPEPFEAIKAGVKTFEFRRDDGRNFQPGDTLILDEWRPDKQKFTGDSVTVRVGFVVRGPDFGVPDGYVVMALTRAWVGRGDDDGWAVGHICGEGLSAYARLLGPDGDA